MRTLVAMLATCASLTACGIRFHPDREGQSYAQTVKMAARISHRAPSSCAIGTIVFSGSLDDRWEEVAHKAAANGGTHYFVAHGGDARSERARFYSDEQNVIIVYRSEPERRHR